MVKAHHVKQAWTEAELAELRGPLTNAELAAKLGRSVASIDHKRSRLKIPAPRPGEAAQPKEQLTIDQGEDASTLTSVSRSIRTLDELLAHTKVDLNEWEEERHVINKWECVMREPATTVQDEDGKALVVTNDKGGKSTLWTRNSNKPLTQPLFQIKVWLRRRVVVARTREIIQGMLQEFRREAPKRSFKAQENKDGLLLEISIFDLHLGKLCWGPEAGHNYDIKISQSAFTDALESLLQRTSGFKVGRILFPVGNDFFNVDNAASTTTAGTPQHEDVRWQKSFVIGRKLMVDAILRMREIAPVDVVMVSGNHDMERIFYLGDTLAGWLSRTDGVSVNNEPTLRKYYQYGKCLVGFTHGKEEKHNNLPLIMATEQSHMWAATKFREMHLGHWHHKKEIHFQPVSEFNGVRVRIIPSLCPADAWHKMKGYEGLRAAEAYLWDKDHGCVGSFSATP
jgi:hypothetical protein